MYILRSFNSNGRLLTFLFGTSCILAVLFIILFPDRIFQSSLKGLEIWWQIVFPALLPFFILTDLLAGFGLFHALGKLFRPVMRLLFRLPGEAGWAVACGMTAGFPAGAHATAVLRRQGIVSLSEGERLLALSHFCSPILLMHVVAIGFFQDVQLGWMLIIIHIASLFVTGLILRGSRSRTPGASNPSSSGPYAADSAPIGHQSDDRMPNPHAAQEADDDLDPIVAGLNLSNEGFGKRLGDAVMSAIQKLMGIGGIMIVFSVIVELIQLFLNHFPLHQMIAPMLASIGLTDGTAKAALSAFFEVHLGAFQFSQQIELPHVLQTALLSSLFAWSGLSAHLQAQSIARNTGLRYRSFIVARLIHAAVAFVMAVLLWSPLHQLLPRTVPGFDPLAAAPISSTFSLWLAGWSTLLMIFAAALLGLICISLICRIVIRRSQAG